MELSAHSDDPHLVDRVSWLRAAVMVANDGIVSVAAVTSAFTFSVFAAIPLIAAFFAPVGALIPVVVIVTLIALAGLGGLGVVAGGAALGPAALRVVVWGSLAMAVTAAVGRLFGVAV